MDFARIGWLGLLLLWPIIELIGWWVGRRRRRALQQSGLGLGQRHRARHPRLVGLVSALGFSCLVVAVAGPRWGTTAGSGAVIGRDLVLVLDLSRSMLAADMQPDARNAVHRWAVARNSLVELTRTLEQYGGHRVAVVIFAAQPAVICPLTTDYAHVRQKLAALEARFPPPEIGPEDVPVISGTRIGRALVAAVAVHDQRFPGYQDILLISDGDDPVGDNEWEEGLRLARQAQIPVHTVGLGSPDTAAVIPWDEAVLTFAGKTIRTRLHADVLEALARQTGGAYLGAQQRPPGLGRFFDKRIEPAASRELPDDALPQPQSRAGEFVALALVVLLMSWLLEIRTPPRLTTDVHGHAASGQ